MGKFKIGHKRVGGRAKGSPNKKSTILKSITEALGLDVPKRLIEILPKLSPEKQADVLLELMSYIYPKRKALENSSDIQPPQTSHTNIELKALIASPEALSALLLLEKKTNELRQPENI